jgi:hypothetical protein
MKNKGQDYSLRKLNSLYLHTLILLLAAPNIAAASFASEAAEIHTQIKMRPHNNRHGNRN